MPRRPKLGKIERHQSAFPGTQQVCAKLLSLDDLFLHDAFTDLNFTSQRHAASAAAGGTADDMARMINVSPVHFFIHLVSGLWTTPAKNISTV